MFLGIVVFGMCAEAFSSVDLHAHLWMEHGSPGLFYTGCFECPLGAKNWKDKLKSKANRESLEKSGQKLVVAALYAHPLAPGKSLRDSIRNQIREAQNWLKKNPQWVLAKNATEAKKQLKEGKRVLVFSVEGGSGILETEEDLKEFVDQEGVAIVTPLHFTDDTWGGCALLKGASGVFINPIPGVKAKLLGRKTNHQGLTQKGHEMLQALIKHRVWIDLGHASDVSQLQMRPMIEAAGQVPLYTHITVRKYHGAERGISDEQLDYVARRKGIVGVIPSTFMVHGDLEFRSGCRTGVDAFAEHYRYISAKVGVDSVMMGSDWNAPMEGLPPGCKTDTSIDQPEGLWNIGQTPEFWRAVRATGVTLPKDQDVWVTRFLEAWARTDPR